MNFNWWFPYRIFRSKGNEKNLSSATIRIGQITVTIGIMVGVISMGSGIGSRKAIKEKLADFEGHITITKYDNNKTFNSSKIDADVSQEILALDNRIEHIQSFLLKSGVIRTENEVEGIVFKGISSDFEPSRFHKFLSKGRLPKIEKGNTSNEILISDKLFNRLNLILNEDVVVVFPKENSENVLYRRFTVVGSFATDIYFLDDVFLVGDIRHLQRLNGWEENQVGGFEIFLKNIEKLDAVSQSIYNKIPYHLYAQSALEKYATIKRWIALFDVNILLILSLMMIVILFNISMVFIIILIERTNTIGLLKTMGGTNWLVMRIFINYALIIMIPGIFFGNILGMGLLAIQQQFGIIQLDPDLYYVKTAPVHFNFLYFFLLSLFSLLISAALLVLPGLIVLRIHPTRAIRFK